MDELMFCFQCEQAANCTACTGKVGVCGKFRLNDLPLSLVLCWFEQKAVCILIALLALGIRGIRLGPTLPAFLSPGVVQALQQKYDLKSVTTPEADLQAILGQH